MPTEIGFMRLAEEPVDLGLMPLGMAEPNPPDRVAQARQPGDDRSGAAR